ncbi:MAG: tetratricopeptide repeat protein [Limisphaerales bacterium]
MTAGFDNQPPDLPSWTQLLGINVRKLRLGLLALLLLAVLGWHGYRLFGRWQQKHLVDQARQFLVKGDDRSAALSAQRALQRDFNDVEATRIMAGLADRLGSPASIFWYGRVAEMEPGNFHNSLTWASTALRFGELTTADQALLTVNRNGRRTATFHQVAGALALALRRIPLAEAHFAAAARLAPTNEFNRLNLATVRLESTNRATATAAQRELERLRGNPQFQTLALRALTSDAGRRKDTNRTLRLARELQSSPQADFKDHLVYLDVLHQAGDRGFDSYLQEIQKLCGSQPGNIYTLVTWMNARGLATQSLAWVNRLPGGLASQLPVPLAVAEAYALLRDWTHLAPIVADTNWRELDCIRLAFHARMLRAQERYREFGTKWDQAVSAAQDNPQLLSLLARLVEGWGWKAEAEETWWAVAKGGAGQPEALQALFRVYSADKATAKLYRVIARINDLNPTDLVAKNNLAQLSLLLGKELETAHRLALENFQKHPTNPAFISTYAYSLQLQGRTDEGLKLFAQIPETLLRQPSMAAYYGVLLAAKGEKEKASKYLGLADQSPQLLPEEQALVTTALNKLKAK